MRLDGSRWRAFAKPGEEIAAGDRSASGEGKVCLLGELDATVEDKGEGGEVTLPFDLAGRRSTRRSRRWAEMPLPPYIAGKRGTDERDRTDYQTIFAATRRARSPRRRPGCISRRSCWGGCEEAGLRQEIVTLHVGAGTFLPVKADDTADHKMHAEWGEVTADTAARLNAARQRGGRIVAVGTTSLRLLESAETRAVRAARRPSSSRRATASAPSTC